jgi:hypothetical protein
VTHFLLLGRPTKGPGIILPLNLINLEASIDQFPNWDRGIAIAEIELRSGNVLHQPRS